jgi:hypothetical protein
MNEEGKSFKRGKYIYQIYRIRDNIQYPIGVKFRS